MNERNKKSLIVLLLLLSCLLSAWLLVTASGGQHRSLESLAQVDSLLQADFQNFSIKSSQVESWFVTVDSTFRRRVFRITLPGRFSKTQLHAEIHRTLHPYGVETPSRVIFPQRDMNIHLRWKETIIRTLQLRTDPDLPMHQNVASILVAFGNPPDPDLQRRFREMGEALVPAVAVRTPMEAGAFRQGWNEFGVEPVVWLREEGGDLDAILRQVGNSRPGTAVVGGEITGIRQAIERHSLDYVPADEARLLLPGSGREHFMEQLDAFAREARRGERPLLIVSAGSRTLAWLREALPEYKKSGLSLTGPATLKGVQ